MRAIHQKKVTRVDTGVPIQFYWMRRPKYNVRLTTADIVGIEGDALASTDGTDFGLRFSLYRTVSPWKLLIGLAILYILFYHFLPDFRTRNPIFTVGCMALFFLLNTLSYYWQRHICKGLVEEFQQAMTAPTFDELRFAYPQNPDRPLLIPLLLFTGISVTCFIIFFLTSVK